MKKIVRLTESDLSRIVKRVIRESKSYDVNNLEELKNEIKTIYDYFENEVEEMVENDGSLSPEVAGEFLDTLEYYIGKVFDNKSEVEYLDEDDYFDLEDYANDTISEFRSFIKNYTD
jgi:hypothetical protein